MLIYWLLLIFFAAGALISPIDRDIALAGNSARISGHHTPARALFLLGAVGMICLIGFRYEVGGDWLTYEMIFNGVARNGLATALRNGDPAYQAVNWLVHAVGYKIWLVNLICGAIFGWGLFRFASAQPAPWLAVAIAVPYMVIVVAMGYTRQGVALGILMAGLARQAKGAGTLNFAVYVAFAASFHKTAAIAFPLVALSARGSRVVNFLIVISASVVLYDFFLSESMDDYVHAYLDTEYSSQGALVRIAMNMVAAALLWGFKGRLGFSDHERKLWRNFSLASVAALVMLAVGPSSTAVDRISIYLMPLQIAVLTRFALVGRNRVAGTVAVLAYVFAIEFVWLNYAQFSRLWVPYQFFPL